MKWLTGLLLLLLGQENLVDMKSPETTWSIAQSFLRAKVRIGGLQTLVRNDDKPLVFGAETAYKMRVYVGENEGKLEREHFESLNEVAAVLAPFVKEAAKCAGVIDPAPQHRYQEAQYKFDLYSECKDKIKEFAKSMKLKP